MIRSRKRSDENLVLLTDGEENDTTIPSSSAIAYCKQFDVKVYTVGAGQAFNPNSIRRFRRTVDTTLLQAMATDTGGRFFVATDTASLQEVYKEIDELETVEIEDFRFTDFRDVYHPLVLAAGGLLALGLLLQRGPYLEVSS